MLSTRIPLAVLVLLILLCASPGITRAEQAISFEEKLLFSIPAEHVKPVLNKGGFASNSMLVINSTRTLGAYTASTNGKNFVVVGNEKGPEFEGEISGVMLGADGKTIVYAVTDKAGAKAYYLNHKRYGEEGATVKNVAMRDLLLFDSDTGRIAAIFEQGDKEYALVDGKKGPEFEARSIYVPMFSPGAKKFAYTVQTPGKPKFVMIDDQKGIESISLDRPVFSPDGSRVAYPIHHAMVLDGKTGPTFRGVNNFNGVGLATFSADGKRFAYKVSQERQFIIADDKMGTQYEKVAADGRIVFSPDGKRIAYTAKDAGRAFVVVDDKPGEPFDDVSDIRFSPDGKRIVYEATLGNQRFLVDNGTPGPKFDKVSVFFQAFGPDSATHAYLVSLPEKKSVIVVNGKAGEPFFNTAPYAPTISPDGKQIAYSVNQQKPGDNKAWVVINDKPSEIYDGVSGAFFSPDSASVAYIVAKEGKQFIIINGKTAATCNNARFLAFSPDSRKLGYVAGLGNEMWWKVVDVTKP